MSKSLEELFEYYNNYFKPPYTNIEARGNTIPAEILFEIHSSFDHIARHYVKGEELDKCVAKSQAHIERGILDLYKLELRDFIDEYKKFVKEDIDFSLIDSGTFQEKLQKKWIEITRKAKEARLSETRDTKEKSFELWSEVSIKISEFEDEIFHSKSVQWGRTTTQKRKWKARIGDLVIGFVASLAVTVVLYMVGGLEAIDKKIKPLTAKEKVEVNMDVQVNEKDIQINNTDSKDID